MGVVSLAPFFAGRVWPTALPFNLLLWLPAVCAAIAVHDIGHAVAGRLAGIRTRDFALRRERVAWMVAGGPLASLLLAGGCLLAFRNFGGGKWDWIGTLFWGNLFPLISLVPISVGTTLFDSARLWQLYRRPERALRWMALAGITAQDSRGVRARDWDSQLLEAALPVAEGHGDAQACLLACYRAMDRNDEEGVSSYLDRGLQAVYWDTPAKRQSLYREAAYVSAIYRRNPVQARAWQARADAIPAMAYAAPDCEISAAIAMAEHRYAAAIEYWTQAQARVADGASVSGTVRLCREKYVEYEVACRNALLTHTEPDVQPSDEAVPWQSPISIPWLSAGALLVLGAVVLLVVFSR